MEPTQLAIIGVPLQATRVICPCLPARSRGVSPWRDVLCVRGCLGHCADFPQLYPPRLQLGGGNYCLQYPHQPGGRQLHRSVAPRGASWEWTGPSQCQCVAPCVHLNLSDKMAHTDSTGVTQRPRQKCAGDQGKGHASCHVHSIVQNVYLTRCCHMHTKPSPGRQSSSDHIESDHSATAAAREARAAAAAAVVERTESIHFRYLRRDRWQWAASRASAELPRRGSFGRSSCQLGTNVGATHPCTSPPRPALCFWSTLQNDRVRTQCQYTCHKRQPGR